VAFRVQKLHFAYKYLVFNLQNCILNYKVASRLAIQQRKISTGEIEVLYDKKAKKFDNM